MKFFKFFKDEVIGAFIIICIGVIITYTLISLLTDKFKLEEEVKQLKIESNQIYQALPIIVTVCNPVKGQTDNTPNITATMNKVTEETLAVSRPLEKYLPMGTKVIWAGDKHCIVNDRMNKRWKEFRIDRYDYKMTNYKKEGLVLIPLKWKE